ncbi:hypothetical protein CR513_49776, partial [Mucuna pruriens]
MNLERLRGDSYPRIVDVVQNDDTWVMNQEEHKELGALCSLLFDNTKKFANMVSMEKVKCTIFNI